MKKINRDGLYTYREVAVLFDRSLVTIYRWIKQGKIIANGGHIYGQVLIDFLSSSYRCEHCDHNIRGEMIIPDEEKKRLGIES